MTNWNRYLPGLAAAGLFVLLALVFLQATFAAPAGFPAGESILLNLGYALFDLELGGIPGEGFLAAFLIVAVGLDVAIDSALFLAKREEGGRFTTGFGDADTDADSGGEA